MSLAKSLNLVEAKRPLKDSPSNTRRSRLIRQIDQQINFADDARAQSSPNRRCWWWVDGDGKYLLAIKYGRRPLELAKGKFAIKCGSSVEIKDALAKVRESVAAGDFDASLATFAAEIRAKFKTRT